MECGHGQKDGNTLVLEVGPIIRSVTDTAFHKQKSGGGGGGGERCACMKFSNQRFMA